MEADGFAERSESDITNLHDDSGLHDSEQRFAQLADSLDVGIALRQLNPLKSLYANQAYIDIFGCDPHPGGLISIEQGRAIVHPDDQQRVFTGYWVAAKAGQRVHTELRIIRPDGEVRWIRSSSRPVLASDGVVTRIAETVDDITQSKTAAAAVREAQDKAERANKSKDEFLSRMSHELRTPLNAVLGFAQLLELDDLAPAQQDAVGQILNGGRHLLAMINDVLDISAIEADRLELSPEPVDIHVLLIDSIGLMQPLAATNGVEIRYESTWAKRRLFVRADNRRLKQVLLNLLSNAIKYNRLGGRVDLGVVSADDDEVCVSVTDTGLGIAEEYLPRTFNAFDRLGRQSTDIEGTGIGLALSQRLITRMGGRLVVESSAGKGSRFTVIVPRAQPPEIPTELIEVDDEPPSGGYRPCTVLYIEDNMSNVDLMTGILRRRPDWTMRHAATGAEGLEVAMSWTPTVILLDLHLPDSDGIDVLRALRAHSTTCDIPVAILSADASPVQVRRLAGAVADRYLTKPMDIREVLAFLDLLSR